MEIVILILLAVVSIAVGALQHGHKDTQRAAEDEPLQPIGATRAAPLQIVNCKRDGWRVRAVLSRSGKGFTTRFEAKLLSGKIMGDDLGLTDIVRRETLELSLLGTIARSGYGLPADAALRIGMVLQQVMWSGTIDARPSESDLKALADGCIDVLNRFRSHVPTADEIAQLCQADAPAALQARALTFLAKHHDGSPAHQRAIRLLLESRNVQNRLTAAKLVGDRGFEVLLDILGETKHPKEAVEACRLALGQAGPRLDEVIERAMRHSVALAKEVAFHMLTIRTPEAQGRLRQLITHATPPQANAMAKIALKAVDQSWEPLLIAIVEKGLPLGWKEYSVPSRSPWDREVVLRAVTVLGSIGTADAQPGLLTLGRLAEGDEHLVEMTTTAIELIRGRGQIETGRLSVASGPDVGGLAVAQSTEGDLALEALDSHDSVTPSLEEAVLAEPRPRQR